ncbi:MAG: hypothetical protein ACI83I_001159 [Bacteroidia bacterium]|jgi:hypothetical protein
MFYLLEISRYRKKELNPQTNIFNVLVKFKICDGYFAISVYPQVNKSRGIQY